MSFNQTINSGLGKQALEILGLQKELKRYKYELEEIKLYRKRIENTKIELFDSLIEEIFSKIRETKIVMVRNKIPKILETQTYIFPDQFIENNLREIQKRINNIKNVFELLL